MASATKRNIKPQRITSVSKWHVKGQGEHRSWLWKASGSRIFAERTIGEVESNSIVSIDRYLKARAR